MSKRILSQEEIQKLESLPLNETVLNLITTIRDRDKTIEELTATRDTLLEQSSQDLKRTNDVLRKGIESMKALKQHNTLLLSALEIYESDCMCRVRGEGRCVKCLNAIETIAQVKGGDS